MNRATLSLHQIEDLAHLDLFLEHNQILVTFEIPISEKDSFFTGKLVQGTRKRDHRIAYLDYEGEISGNRGKVKILWKGYFQDSEIFFLEKMKFLLTEEKNLVIIPSRI